MISRFSTYLQQVQHLFGMARNAGWLMAEKLVRLGTGFFIGVWVASYFGPEAYSVFTYSFSIVIILRAIAGLGLRGIFVRDFVTHPEERSTYLGTSAGMMAVAGFLSYCLAVLVIYLLNTTQDQSLLLVGILAVQLLLYPTEVINFFFEAKVESKHSVLARLAGYVVGAGIKIAIVLLGGTVVHLALAYLADYVVTALGYLLVGHRQGIGYRHWNWKSGKARRLLAESWYLILAGVMVTLYMQVDKPMVYKIAGERQNGLYSFAVQLAEACYILPVIVQQSAFPNLVAAGKRDETEFLLKIGKLMRLLFYSSIAVATVLTLGGDYLVTFITNGKYAESGPMLRIVIWALPFVSSGMVQGAYLVSKGLLPYSLYLTALGTLVNVSLNLILIPEWGGVGAAYATVVSYAVAGFLGGFLFRKTRPLSYLLLRAIFWRNPSAHAIPPHDQ